MVSETTETEVHFSYLLSGYDDKDFAVKPLIGNGSVEIFNSEKNEWVGSFSLEDHLPKISETMLIRIRNLNVEKTYLWFEIKSLRDGKSYITPKKSIWSEKVYDGYIEEVNYSISNYKEALKESSNEAIEVSEVYVNYKNPYVEFLENIPKLYYMYISLILFLISAVFSFLYRKPKAKREMIQSISEDFKKLDTGDLNVASNLRFVLNSRKRDK
jgi:hypothetical protein